MKKVLTRTIPGIIIVFLLLALAVAAVMSATYRVLIRDSESKFYKAKAVFIAGDFVFFLRDSALYDFRKQAIETAVESYRPSFASMKEIDFIEVIHDEPSPDEEAVTGALPSKYLGNFKINAEGNNGNLFLRYGNGILYGSVRFPSWGKGGFEPLKRLYIGNGRIRFIRSVTTRQEMERLGSNMMFVQEYTGTFSRDGNKIHGFYTVGGSRKTWEAYRK